MAACSSIQHMSSNFTLSVPWRHLTRSSWGLGQMGARPFARFDARRKRPEIDHGDTAKGVAAIWAAMRDDEVACAGGFPDPASPSPKELDRGIDIVAADSARAPDSHVRRQLLFRLIRYFCGATRRRRNRIIANQEGRILDARPPLQHQHCQMDMEHTVQNGTHAGACKPLPGNGHASPIVDAVGSLAKSGRVQRSGLLPHGSRTFALTWTRSTSISTFQKRSRRQTLLGDWGVAGERGRRISQTRFSTCECSELHTRSI